MKENKLITLSLDFAVKIIELVKELKAQKENIISNQIGRSGTSIGANIHEAQYAHSKNDFIAKLEIALKESNETSYWLQLSLKTGYIIEAKFKEIDSLCANIRVMLIKSCKTAKDNI
ncbi:MAG: four helix bundle protein [Clostridiales bacterium]|jgi:four helix bundle protein|nr:four helix bundle protein [Clostridiales bacterium]